MDPSLQTLFLALKESGLQTTNLNVAYLNAQAHSDLSQFKSLFLYQTFKPYADLLIHRGFDVSSTLKSSDNVYDVILINLPKNVTEALYLIARGLEILKSSGVIFCAADNKAGGTRIKKMLQDLGLNQVHEISKNKARACWAIKENIDQNAIQNKIAHGDIQAILDGQFFSQPGIFGWNKIDKGSEILLQTINHDLSGTGADFGCGYGFLSRSALELYPKIKKLYCIDADKRSIDLCEQNLKSYKEKTNFIWADLTRTQKDLKNLDFIVMNPPFHEGKKTDSDIGMAFIINAHHALKAGGMMFMVANISLNYERVLNESFREIRNLHQGQGFKVFLAIK